MNALVLRYEEIHSTNIEGVEESDIDAIVRFGHRPEAGLKGRFGRLADTLQLIEFLDLAQRYRASVFIAITLNIFSSPFVDEESHGVVAAKLMQFRKFNRNFARVL